MTLAIDCKVAEVAAGCEVVIVGVDMRRAQVICFVILSGCAGAQTMLLPSLAQDYRREDAKQLIDAQINCFKREAQAKSLTRIDLETAALSVQGGRTIYLAGQVAFDRDRNIIGGDVVAQARQALRNMKTAVEAAGGALSDIVQITLHIVDYTPDQLNPIAGTLLEFFPPDRLPANTLVAVSSLSVQGLLIEITGIRRSDRAEALRSRQGRRAG